jgi:hypothetical protein
LAGVTVRVIFLLPGRAGTSDLAAHCAHGTWKIRQLHFALYTIFSFQKKGYFLLPTAVYEKKCLIKGQRV